MPFCMTCKKKFDDVLKPTHGFVCIRCMANSSSGNSQSYSNAAVDISEAPRVRFMPFGSSDSTSALYGHSNQRYLHSVLQRRRFTVQRHPVRERRPIHPSAPIERIGMNTFFYSKLWQVEVDINFDKITPPRAFIDQLGSLNVHTITLGDLHGNTLVLIMVLVRFGFIEFPNAENYERMRQIIIDACSQPLTVENYIEFRTLLYACKRSNKLNIRVLRLLGDVIGDRQSNDVLTLAVFGFLLSECPETYTVTIVFSNHDKNLIDYLVAQTCFSRPFDSFVRLTDFFQNIVQIADPICVVIRENILTDMRLYVSSIKLLDYEHLRTEENINGDISVFTHAPLHPVLGCSALFDMLGRYEPNSRLRFFNPPRSFANFTKYELMDIIRKANQIFSNMLLDIFTEKVDQVFPPIRILSPTSTLTSPVSSPGLTPSILSSTQSLNSLSFDSPSIAKYQALFSDDESPCSSLIWFRLPLSMQQDEAIGTTHLSLPQLVEGITLFSVHGHDLMSRLNDISLDNEVGKSSLSGKSKLKLILTIKE